MELTKTRLHAGHWEGVLTHAEGALPALTVTHQGAALEAPQITPLSGSKDQSLVRLRIPAELLGEGVQTFLINDAASGEKLAHFSIIAGEAADDDLRAELTLLRAELDMLKKAFRRHCAETA